MIAVSIKSGASHRATYPVLSCRVWPLKTDGLLCKKEGALHGVSGWRSWLSIQPWFRLCSISQDPEIEPHAGLVLSVESA